MNNILFRFCITFLTLLYLISFANINEVCAEKIRNPAWAGLFYPKQQSELKNVIENLTCRAKLKDKGKFSHMTLKALILPHAGYIYSGLTAACACFVLKNKKFEKVILIGPDHNIGFKNGVITDADAYQTPLGMIEIDKDATMLLSRSDLFQLNPVSDKKEHSIEVVLPFLQYYLNKFKLVPIIAGPCNINSFASSIDPLLDHNTLLVASSDLSHYLSYDDAVQKDKETINMILKLDHDKLLNSRNRACGKIPILILINLARRHGWKPAVLHYSNSGDAGGKPDKIVGYGAIAFFGGKDMKEKQLTTIFDYNQGQILLKLARKTISEKLGKKVEASDSFTKALKDSAFKPCQGTFVTLKIDKHLRGCIGSLETTDTILNGVKVNAINAAFHDPRFPALQKKELDSVNIEVSILTRPKPLHYIDGNDLIKKLRVNKDGVIIRKEHLSATFLPQVWEQLPKPENFLNNLCLKAGMPENAWKNSKPDVLTYQVQYFEEEK